MSKQWDDEQTGTSLSGICGENLFISEEAIIRRQLIEKKMVRCVAVGDYTGAKKLLYEMPQTRDSISDFFARADTEEESLRTIGLVMNSALRVTLMNTNVPVTIIHGLATYFGRLANTVSLEYLRAGKLFDSILKGYCIIAKEFGHKPYSPAVERIADYIVINIANKISLQQLADEFNYSPVHINRLLRQETGYSAVQFIKQKRISLAKALMNFEDAPMEEIAAMVGYSDYNYFCRVFRQVEQMSPSKYLEKGREMPAGEDSAEA